MVSAPGLHPGLTTGKTHPSGPRWDSLGCRFQLSVTMSQSETLGVLQKPAASPRPARHSAAQTSWRDSLSSTTWALVSATCKLSCVWRQRLDHLQRRWPSSASSWSPVSCLA